MEGSNFVTKCKYCGCPTAGAYEWMRSEKYLGYCYNCEQSMERTTRIINCEREPVDELEVEYAYFVNNK